MGFDKIEFEKLLAECGRRCCICGKLHRVQIHHIKPKEKGGTDDIDNGLPPCPTCHDEVHTEYSSGRTTKVYSATELRLHRQRTIKLVKHEGNWTPESPAWKKDKKLIAFFAQCLDRPAFHAYFHQELSFLAFDKAMEDTLIAFNTGYWRMRDGTLIERGKSKTFIVNPEWRNKLDEIVLIIEGIRTKFSDTLRLNRMLNNFGSVGRFGHPDDFDDMMRGFRCDRDLAQWMDNQRQKAIDLMNILLH